MDFDVSRGPNFFCIFVIMKIRMETGWKKALATEFDKPYFKVLTDRVRSEYANPNLHIYPPTAKLWVAFDLSPFHSTKVVIVGQDPYHGPNQANGLCFSVEKGVTIPPSLRNIFKEVHEDTGAPIPADGDLSRWARQGVLLLNSSLSVREHQPKSHAGWGWELFTDAVVNVLASQKDNIVFMLWGADAIRKGANIDKSRHLVLSSVHPSPLSAHRGFFGNHHFSRANEYLVAHGKLPVIW